MRSRLRSAVGRRERTPNLLPLLLVYSTAHERLRASRLCAGEHSDESWCGGNCGGCGGGGGVGGGLLCGGGLLVEVG